MPTDDTRNGQYRDGWFNYCRKCGRRYWVRVADLHADHMRRFTDRESNERHECEATVAP